MLESQTSVQLKTKKNRKLVDFVGLFDMINYFIVRFSGLSFTFLILLLLLLYVGIQSSHNIYS